MQYSSITSKITTLTVFFLLVGLMSAIFASPKDNYLDFDGVNDYVNASDVTQLNSAPAFSIEAWMKRSALSAPVMISKAVNANNKITLEYNVTGAVCFYVSHAGPGTACATLNDVQWHHITLVFNGSQASDATRLKGYVDGVQQTLTFIGTIPSISQGALGNLQIGRLAPTNQYASGSIDDVRVWSRPLTQAEISTNMNSELSGAESGLVAYWKFNEGLGQTAFDSTPSGYSGVLGSTANADANDPSWNPPPVPDTTPPTVSLTSPAGGSISGTITITATASDNIAVAGVQFKVDGINISTEDTSSPYSVSWDSNTVSEGARTLTVVARDTSNNTATSTGVSVTVSNPPVLSGGAPAGTLAGGTTSTTLSLSTNEAATCRYSTSSGVSYASMTNTFSTTGSTSHSTAVSGLTNGTTYTYYVKCTDGTNPNTADYPIAFSVSTGVWIAPIGIPYPPFGINEQAPSDPSPWTSNVANFYYVQNGGTNPGNGYPGNPRGNIPNPIPAGSVVEVRGGPYTGGQMNIIGTGTPASPIFVRGPSTGTKPIIRQDIVIAGQYIILENLDVDTKTVGFPPGSSNNHLALRNSEVHNGPFGAITAGVGIGVWDPISPYPPPVTNVTIYNNVIHDNGNVNDTIDNDYHGIAVASSAEYIWIVDNEFYTDSGDSVQINPGNSISQRPTTNHIYVGRNTGHGNRQSGFWAKSAEDVIFSQNKAYNLPIGMGYQYDPVRVWFLFNEVYGNANGFTDGSTDIGGRSDIYFIGNLAHDNLNAGMRINDGDETVNIIGNTIYNNPRGIENGYYNSKTLISNNIIVASTSHIDFNAGYSTGASSDARNTLFSTPAQIMWDAPAKNVSQFQATGECSGCKEGNPNFVDPASKNFNLLSSSPAIDAGVSEVAYSRFQQLYGLNINVSYNGVARPQGAGWDMGAFEYVSGGGGDTTPPVLSSGAPSGALAADTTSTLMSVITNEAASCRFSTIAGTNFSSMPNLFSATGGTIHSTTISGLSNGNTYNYYVKCQDLSPAANANTADYAITFSVASASDIISPSVFIASPFVNTSNITTYTVLASDDFERASLGSNWTIVGNTDIVNSRDMGLVSAGALTLGSGMWTATNFPVDQFSEITISMDKDPTMMVQAFIRRRSSDSARYGFHYNNESIVNEWEIKYDGVPSAQVRIVANNTIYPKPSIGDTLRIQAIGSTIKGFHKCASCSTFTEVLSATDTASNAINTTGPPGTVFRSIGLATVPLPTPVVSSWSGGSVTTYTVTTPTIVSGTINLAATASDNVGVAGVQFKLDGNNLNPEDTISPYSINWDTTTESNGPHTITATARDAAGNTNTSQSVILNVSNTVSDVTPPVLSNGGPSGILPAGTASTNLLVETDETATCRYSTSSGIPYLSMTNTFSVTGGMTHSTAITNLFNGTTYNYYSRCIDVSNNSNAVDYTVTFSVAAANSTLTPPNISAISIASLSFNSATITWFTDKPATSRVEYGTTTSYGFFSDLDTSLTPSHTVTLTGIQQNTQYNFRVLSAGSDQAILQSSNYIFTTPSAPVSPAPGANTGGGGGGGGIGGAVGNRTTAPGTPQVVNAPTGFNLPLDSITLEAMLEPDEPVKFNLSSDFPIRSVSMRSLQATDENGTVIPSESKQISIVIKKVESPSVPSPPVSTYKYVRMDANTSKFDVITVNFDVPIEWANANNATTGTIKLLRYSNGWKQMFTYYLGSNGTHYQFTSDVPGFSVFAIVVQKSTDKLIEEPSNGTFAIPPIVSADSNIPINSQYFALSAALFFLVLVVYVYRIRHKKDKYFKKV